MRALRCGSAIFVQAQGIVRVRGVTEVTCPANPLGFAGAGHVARET